MAAANPNSFDHYRRGQSTLVLKAKVDNKTFDYYRRGQPYFGEVIISAVRIPRSISIGHPFNV